MFILLESYNNCIKLEKNEILQFFFNLIIISTFTLIKLQYSFIILFPRITLDWYNISNCKYMIWVWLSIWWFLDTIRLPVKTFYSKLILHKNNTCKSFLVRRQMGTILLAIEEQDRKNIIHAVISAKKHVFLFCPKSFLILIHNKILINVTKKESLNIKIPTRFSLILKRWDVSLKKEKKSG